VVGSIWKTACCIEGGRTLRRQGNGGPQLQFINDFCLIFGDSKNSTSRPVTPTSSISLGSPGSETQTVVADYAGTRQRHPLLDLAAVFETRRTKTSHFVHVLAPLAMLSHPHIIRLAMSFWRHSGSGILTNGAHSAL
jgi:hypothetical protein